MAECDEVESGGFRGTDSERRWHPREYGKRCLSKVRFDVEVHV
jgi:hypothetical protein